MANLVEVGKFGKPHGVRGAIRFWPLSAGANYLTKKSQLTIRRGDVEEKFAIRAMHQQQRFDVIELEGVASPEEARTFTHARAFVDVAALPKVAADEFYYHEVLDRQAVTPEGKTLGTIVAVYDHGAGDLLEIRGAVEYLIPVQPGVIADIPEQGPVVILAAAGILELYENPSDD